MAETPTRVLPTTLGTATATIKTAGGANTWVIVRSIILCNIGAAAATVNVGVGTTNTDTAGTRIASSLAINPGETIELLAPGILVLQGSASTPDILHALCSAANTVTMSVNCIEGP